MSTTCTPKPEDESRAASVHVYTETVVIWMGNQRVALVNVRQGTYTLPDGTQQEGPTVQLRFLSDNHSVRVGPGSIVEVEGASWKIVAVDIPWFGNGRITLEQLSTASPSKASVP